MKKLRTYIKGLDKLFHGGLQIGCLSEKDKPLSANESLVIVIKGMKGTYKPLLAMQLMCGIAKSLHEDDNAIANAKANFFSINKRAEDLNDTYLDILIKSELHKMIRKYRKDEFEGIDEQEISKRFQENNILDFIFDISPRKKSNTTLEERERELYTRYVCQSLVYYNVRTNALHWKRGEQGDDNKNFIAARRYDTINDYTIPYQKLEANRQKIEANFKDNLIFVDFNDLGGNNRHYLENDFQDSSPMSKFREIQNAIQTIKEQIEDNKSNADDKNKDNRRDVIVIDGFSQLSTSDLTTLPYTCLIKLLRKTAKVSILVFDDRSEANCDGDVVIEMRKRFAEVEEYMFHELQISKSTFQEAAIGWHQYKKRDDGIEVFPSLHKLLSKRYYMPNKGLQIGQSIFQIDFDQYLATEEFLGALNSNPQSSSDRNFQSKFDFELFFDKQNDIENNLRKYIFDKYKESIKTSENDLENEWKKAFSHLFLLEPDISNKPFGLKNHFDATALIGNPNSYKRYLAVQTAYSYARQGIHTLFFLFDKNEADMRRMMVCPACITCADDKRCTTCSRRIHMMDLRMGCLSAEEFFATLLDQISFYCQYNEKTGREEKWMHIVIDDLQKVDFSFPFLSSQPLFLSTLFSICRNHNVKLTILCDKKANLVKELCSLADNVVTIRREEKAPKHVEINVSRGASMGVPSRILKFTTEDILHVFRCSEEEGVIIDEEKLTVTELGSLKGYWRKTVNSDIKEFKQITNNDTL